MPKKQTTVGFDEIFYFAAKEPYNVSWNAANDLFFNDDTIKYKGTTTFYQSECESESIAWAKDDQYKNLNKSKALGIISDFMKENNLTEMLVLGD